MHKIILFLLSLTLSNSLRANNECSGAQSWVLKKKGAGLLDKAWNRTFLLTEKELIWCGEKGNKGFHKIGSYEYRIIKEFAIKTGSKNNLKFAEIPLDQMNRKRKTLHLSQCSDKANCSSAQEFDAFVEELKES